jgi:hypothetical protein
MRKILSLFAHTLGVSFASADPVGMKALKCSKILFINHIEELPAPLAPPSLPAASRI